MQRKRKKVLYIDSESAFLEQQKHELCHKELDGNLVSFNNLTDAFAFIETQVIEKNDKLHYIILGEKVLSKHLTSSLEKLWGLNNFLNKPDIIVITDENDVFLRNRVMQYPFVAVYLVKPIPSSYIEFLITGQPS